MNDAVPTPPIAEAIVNAILSRRLAPGVRLSEQALAELFGVNRTAVREALTGLAARGMVEVNARRGWFVVQPSEEDTREVFATRQVIEAGMLLSLGKTNRSATKLLRDHVAQERAAILADDVAEGSYLLGDFHVCLAECVGSPLLAEIMRDLTARTTLIASLVQSKAQALQSCAEHAMMISALQRGHTAEAIALMHEHIDNVSQRFSSTALTNPRESLRNALMPAAARLPPARPPKPAAKAPDREPGERLFAPLLRSVPRSEKA